MTAVEFLAELSREGVKIWAESNQLHYQAPKGAMAKFSPLEASGV